MRTTDKLTIQELLDQVQGAINDAYDAGYDAGYAEAKKDETGGMKPTTNIKEVKMFPKNKLFWLMVKHARSLYRLKYSWGEYIVNRHEVDHQLLGFKAGYRAGRAAQEEDGE